MSNIWTQNKKLWIAEQAAKQKTRDEKEARTELKREMRRMSDRQAVAARNDKNPAAAREAQKRQMKFMYAPPPGYQKALDKSNGVEDDEEVKAFKRSLVRKAENFSGATISNLERQVGRRERKGLTMDELVERHPELANAPTEGKYAANVKLNFKPFNKQIKNTRCMRCGEYGHSSGDGTCPMANSNPHNEARRKLEDPMTYMATAVIGAKQDLLLKRSLLPGASSTDAKYKILSDSDDEQDIERAFLAKLTKKEKKRLLKKMSGVEDSDSSSSSSSDSAPKKKSRKRKKSQKKSKKGKKAKKERQSKKDKKHKKKRSRQSTD